MTDTPQFRSDMTVELVKHSAADSDVLWAARVSTAGEQSLDEVSKDPGRSRGLINYLMRDRHGSPFEHNSMTFFISAPLFVFREFHRHRVGWCLAGNTTVTLQDADGSLRYRTIAALHTEWHSAGPGSTEPEAPALHVRSVNEVHRTPERTSVVDVLASGTKRLLRMTTESGRQLRCSADHAVLTPDGWRKVGELVAGQDEVLTADPEAADGAAANGPVHPDRIAAMVEDGEEMTYDLSLAGPWHNFLADGVVVHNSYNEESGRYRELEPVFYLPGEERKLVQQGRPGRYEFVPGTPEQHGLVSDALAESYRQSYAAYQEMLEGGVAREVARAALPLGLYSSMYATCNARSLMHFLGLRTQHEAAAVPSFPQREIAMVAERLEEDWARLMPLTHAAFNANGRVAP